MDTREKHIFYFLFIALTLMFAGLILFSYIRIMVQSESARRSSPYSIDISERVLRGSIYDSDHRLLAVEQPVYSVSLWIPNIRDPEGIARTASAYLDVAESQLLDRIKRHNGFLYVKRGVDSSTAEQLQDEINRQGLRGIYLEKQYGRFYPYRDMAAQTIGFVDIENSGASGIEYFYDDQLYPLPRPGQQATYGNDLILTLSVPFQAMLDDAINSIFSDHQPDGVSGIIIDGSTGDILAIASHPSFDLNQVGQSTENQRLHRAVSSMYEPGSVFKIYSLAAILEETGTSHDPFICRGTHELSLGGGRSMTIRCTTDHGTVDVGDIIRYSCNNAIAALSMEADDLEFYETLLDFGFSQRTGAGLPGESRGRLSHPSQWSARSKPTIAFGQESSMTALQAASAATAFTNGGMILQPHIIREIRSADGSLIYEREITETHRAVSEEIAEEIVSYMERAVGPGGTAVRMHTEGIQLAAKTGTAQLTDPETGEYSRERYLASCIALLPGEETTYIVYIAADYPKAGSIYGATVVVPYIKQIIDQAVEQGYLTTR